MDNAHRNLEPVFVFGALRSGTTLFRLMLNAHGQICNPGEADFLFDYLTRDSTHPTGWRYDRDGMQQNRIFQARGLNLSGELDGLDLLHDMIQQLGSKTKPVLTLNIHRHAERAAVVLPDARFIHLLRDPRDVARSSIGMGWAGNIFHGVDHWIATEMGWDVAARKINADMVLTIKFESLMANLEDELNKVCKYLGVQFSDTMIGYHKDTTYGPPDPRIAEKWRSQADPYQIALLEGKCGELIAARGYQLNADPAYPGAFERFMIGTSNRFFRWRHGIRRFGLPLFFASHLSRILGLETWKTRVRQRMDVKVIEGLK